MASPGVNGTVSIFRDSEGHLHVCVSDDKNVGSPGVFYGKNPFDYVLPATLCQLFVVILTSQALYFLLRPIRTPKFICNVVGGILLGPSFLGRNKAYWEALSPPRQADVTMFGFLAGAAYFVFFAVLKMDVRMTIRAAKSTWRFGIVPFLASCLVTSTFIKLFYLPHHMTRLQQEAIGFISPTMSFSFFPVISEALGELNFITTELGQIALSSAMCNDVIEWLHIAYLRVVVENDIAYSVFTLCCYFLFLLFSVYVIRPTMKLIARRTPVGKPVKESYVVLILVGVLAMAAITDAIGLSFVMGPLFFGLVIPSGPPLGTTLVDKGEALVSEIFLPFFFIYIGMNTNLLVIQSWREIVTFQSILYAGCLVKMLACVLVGLTYGIRPKHGIVLGLMLNIKGLIELMVSSRMKIIGVLDEKTFSHLVLFIVEITAIATPLVKLLYKHRPRVLHAYSSHDGQMSTIQDTPRNSEFRIITCIHNEGNVRGIIALLEACNPVIESPICTYVIHLIELLGKSAPILLPINYKQNKKFLSVNYPNTNHIMRAFENYSRNSSGPVTVLPYINVAPYKSMHEAICNLAQDKMVPLLIIPFHENDHIDLHGHAATSIYKVNTKFQNHAPCTIGILVDRYSQLGASDSKYTFNVGIFFIGGQDDREALALGIRMSEKLNVVVSLFRFQLVNKKHKSQTREEEKEEEEEEEIEEMLDESLVDEFKSRKFGSGHVSWCEIMVEDGIEVLTAIRGLEGNYDLVMVGRRHSIGCLNDEEMAKFIENTEILGIYGDMLSSTEFCIGMVPVLVTQCGGRKANQLDRVGSTTTVSRKSSVVL